MFDYFNKRRMIRQTYYKHKQIHVEISHLTGAYVQYTLYNLKKTMKFHNVHVGA